MLDTLTSHNAQDFQRRYQGTIGFLVQPGAEKILVTLGKVKSDCCTFYDISGTKYFANANKDVYFEFIPVNRGWYNGEKRIKYIERRPERQWHRGICDNNTLAFICDARGGLLNDMCSIEFLSDIFGKPTAVTTALEQWHSGVRDGVALSREFSIVADTLMFWRAVVGKVKDKANIVLSHDIVQQEVQDLIRRNNLPFKVEIQ